MCFFTLGSSKIEDVKKIDIVGTQNERPSYVKHDLGSICAFFSLFWYWVCAGGGSPKGLEDNLFVQILALG